jgi:hypothetical protein
MNKNYKRDITPKNIEDILAYIKKVKNTHRAIRDLKESGVIPSDISQSCYKRRLCENTKYRKLMEWVKAEKVRYHQEVIDLKMKGYGYKEIYQLTGINYNTIYSILKKSKSQKSRDMTGLTERKAKTIVNWIKSNPIDGRFLTQQAKDAFEFLGLKIPA